DLARRDSCSARLFASGWGFPLLCAESAANPSGVFGGAGLPKLAIRSFSRHSSDTFLPFCAPDILFFDSSLCFLPVILAMDSGRCFLPLDAADCFALVSGPNLMPKLLWATLLMLYPQST